MLHVTQEESRLEGTFAHWSAHFQSFLGRDSVGNFVILGLRHDAPLHHFAGFEIGTPCNHPVRFCRSHAQQAQQLLFVAVFKSSGLSRLQPSRIPAATASASRFTSAVACAVFSFSSCVFCC